MHVAHAFMLVARLHASFLTGVTNHYTTENGVFSGGVACIAPLCKRPGVFEAMACVDSTCNNSIFVTVSRL